MVRKTNEMVQELDYEEYGIGLRNESSLHSEIKRWYSEPGDRLEVKVDGYVIDIVRGEELIEIQTKNFGAIGRKLGELSKSHRVRLVHPVSLEKYIILMDQYEEIISRRKSPKRGEVVDVFRELVRIPYLINEENFSLEVIMTKEEEIRKMDGKGSWRRKGISIVDRRLLEIVKKYEFKNKEDFKVFLPEELNCPFLNRELAEVLGISTASSQRIVYCLKKMGLIRQVGKKGRSFLYEIC